MKKEKYIGLCRKCNLPVKDTDGENFDPVGIYHYTCHGEIFDSKDFFDDESPEEIEADNIWAAEIQRMHEKK